MFTQLVASRPPAAARGTQGLVLSALLHASIIGAAFTVKEQVRIEPVDPGPPPIYLAPTAPRTDAPTGPARAPSPTDVGPLDRMLSVPDIVVPDIAPMRIPVTIPEPSMGPWATQVGSRDGLRHGQPGTTGSGVLAGGAPWHASQVEVAAALAPRSPTPRYPEALRRAQVEGVVRMAFVVDTLGRVEPSSVRVVSSAHALFEAAVRAALPRLRFSPARVGGRPVRQLVEFPVAFTLATP